MSGPSPDQQNAALHQTERMRNLLAFVLVGAFISVFPVFTFFAIPAQNKDIITYMVGQLSGMALTAIGFYFVNKVGQDAVDAKRTDNTAKLLDIAAAATAGAAGAGTDAGKAADDVAEAATDKAQQINGGKL